MLYLVITHYSLFVLYTALLDCLLSAAVITRSPYQPGPRQAGLYGLFDIVSVCGLCFCFCELPTAVLSRLSLFSYIHDHKEAPVPAGSLRLLILFRFRQ